MGRILLVRSEQIIRAAVVDQCDPTASHILWIDRVEPASQALAKDSVTAARCHYDGGGDNYCRVTRGCLAGS